MAAVLEKQDAAAKNGSQVDEQIAQATSRIRAHDLAFGGLVLLALVLVYTTAMICLDRYFVLPNWARQLALFGFFATLGATAYVTLFSPLRKRINPLYAARQVERTIDDAKNSVTGYIDAQQKGDLNSTVKAALASRAAKSVAEADVNKAVDHRSLIYLGGLAVAFFLALVVLFFIFRPSQFASLVGRAWVPFSSGDIRSRTELTLVKPDPAEPTITTGQSIQVAVHVAGKVPNADGPDKVRLLVRHNLADPNYDELPMVRGDTARDWELRVPDYLVQNGFWYKVAAGDAVTPEYKVTVRSLPLFNEFQAAYEYPKYLRRKPDSSNGPLISGYRGTTVTLQARTNRDVRDGMMVTEPGNVRVAGTVVPGKPDTLQFVFKLAESGRYKLTFNSTNGEHTADPFQSTITIETDAAPQVVITKPEDEKPTEQPVNGQLTVDGKVGDDFGIDTVTLKMRIVSPVERPLADVPYMNGATPSFRRNDETWPTDLDYKGSVDFAKLKKDAAGLALELTPGMEIEYWLEATDNCTEPKANVGRSQPKRVRLTTPKAEEAEQKDLDKQKDERKNDEKKHNDQQKQKLDNEKREPNKKNGQTDKNNDANKEKNGEQPTEPKTGEKGENPPKQGDEQTPKDPTQKGADGNNGKGMTEPKNGQPDMPPNPSDPNNPQPNPAPPPKTSEQKKVEQDAEDLKKELDKDTKDGKAGGSGKGNPTPKEEERTDSGTTKPQPTDGMAGKDNPAEPKPAPKQANPNDPANPMGQPDAAPASDKSKGEVKKSEDPSTPKPEEKKGEKGEPMPGQKDAAPAETRDRPLGPPQSGDKEQPKEPQPAPKDPNAKQDPKSGSSAKPATEKKDGEQDGMPGGAEKKDPAGDAGRTKPMPDNSRGGDKPPAPQPKETPAPGTKPPADPEAGEGKPAEAPPAGGQKPVPKEDPMSKGTGGDAETKPTDNGANDPMKTAVGGAATAKPDKSNNTPMGGKSVEKGGDKPAPNDAKGKPEGGDAPQPKLDEKTRKELEQAAKDLNSNDPQKKKDAQDKLDKAIGEEKRKEVEQIAKDLKSDDKGKREAAEKKVQELTKQPEGQKGGDSTAAKKDPPKLDEKEMKELAQAAKDLQSNDPQKKQAAQQKLDKAIGEEKRKEFEQLGKDLKSDDKDTREAAEKKVGDELKKEMDKQASKKGQQDEGKGKEPTPEEIADLMKKAQDLQSKDEKTKQQAQKELDEKIGEENRKKLEEAMKDQKPGDPEQDKKTKEQLEQMAKNPPKKSDNDINPKGVGSSPPAKGPMQDAKKHLEEAELLLDQFEKNRKSLQAKKGWTDAEYEAFLKGYRDLVEQRREEAKKEAAAGPKQPYNLTGDPTAPIKAGDGGKVEALPGAQSGPASAGSGPTAAPPGFESARDKFQRALEKKKP